MDTQKKYNLPTELVILGATGDLASTKLLPSLFSLYIKNLLPDSFFIIGVAREELNTERYAALASKLLRETFSESEDKILQFASCLHYVQGDIHTDDTYVRIKEKLLSLDESIGQCTSKLFYIAVKPDLYGDIFTQLKKSGCMSLCSGIGTWSRLLVEKPFGSDLKTALALESQLQELFDDEQVYRIDHYLEKDAIENILALRFANSILANSWNNKEISSITIRILETSDISKRGYFYRDIGALRDVGQNHMLQIFALLTMKTMDIDNAVVMRRERNRMLTLLEPQNISNLVRAQYEQIDSTPGITSDDKDIETYFSFSTRLDHEDWKGVDFHFTSGKALDCDLTDAIIGFKQNTHCSCHFSDVPHEHKNELRITFSPVHKVELDLWFKKPGFTFALEKQTLTLIENDSPHMNAPSAYEHVLTDCIAGNQTRFVSKEEVASAWKFITPILDSFHNTPMQTYSQGSTGPNI